MNRPNKHNYDFSEEYLTALEDYVDYLLGELLQKRNIIKLMEMDDNV